MVVNIKLVFNKNIAQAESPSIANFQ